MLRARREAMGATLAEAEAATRIRQKYLAALEAEEWALLPGEVVGRGFLRNYAAYLGLEPTEILERRRAVIDSRLASALSSTSAGAQLPGARAVDYRPKEMELKDEPDGITRGEIRMTPFLSILLTLLALALIAWGLNRFGNSSLGGFFPNLGISGQNVTLDSNQPSDQADVSLLSNVDQIPAVPVVTLAPITVVVNPENAVVQTPQPQPDNNNNNNLAESTNIDSSANIILRPTTITAANQTAANQAAAFPTLIPTRTPIPTPTPVSANSESSTALGQPTATPLPAADNINTTSDPTNETQPPTLLPTATVELTPVPTSTPAPTAPPPPSPPQCPDWRTVLSAPFNNEVVQGLVQVRGTATHEDFRYYRIEYAFGANATSGFTYFTGGNAPVFQGVLGQLDTTSLPNETYTIRVAVIDSTGNFSPPCQVTLIFAN